MFKRGLFVVIAVFVFSLNTKPALSITIPAGGEGIYTFDFSLIGINPSNYERIMYNLDFSDGWNGVLSLYDELNQDPLYEVSYPYTSKTDEYTRVFYKNLVDPYDPINGLFADQKSYWKISPLTNVAVGDSPAGGGFAYAYWSGVGYAVDGVLTVTSPVPIPGAVWLFGSGLLGLVGIGRRRMKN